MLSKLALLKQQIEGLAPIQIHSLIDANPSFVALVKELNQFYFKQSLTGCNNCIFDAVVRLIRKYNVMNEKKETQFRLANGIVINDPKTKALHLRISSLFMTDEAAFFHLSRDKKLIKYFDKFPENWKEQVKQWEEQNSSKIVKEEPKEVVNDIPVNAEAVNEVTESDKKKEEVSNDLPEKAAKEKPKEKAQPKAKGRPKTK